MFIAPTKWLLFQDRRTVIDNVNVTSLYDDSMLEVFEDLAVYPDSDVVLAQRFDGDFLHLTSVYRISPQRKVIWENRGNWTVENGLQMRTFDVASARRRNLQQTTLKSCLVVLFTYSSRIRHVFVYCRTRKRAFYINDTWLKIFHLQTNMCNTDYYFIIIRK